GAAPDRAAGPPRGRRPPRTGRPPEERLTSRHTTIRPGGRQTSPGGHRAFPSLSTRPSRPAFHPVPVHPCLPSPVLPRASRPSIPAGLWPGPCRPVSPRPPFAPPDRAVCCRVTGALDAYVLDNMCPAGRTDVVALATLRSVER